MKFYDNANTERPKNILKKINDFNTCRLDITLVFQFKKKNGKKTIWHLHYLWTLKTNISTIRLMLETMQQTENND